MIGVIANDEERKFVEEFFQLFKTPWEYYRDNGDYDVILSAGRPPVGCRARLMLIYTSRQTKADRELGVSSKGSQQGGMIEWRGEHLPIRGDLLTFEPGEYPVLCRNRDSQPAAMLLEKGDVRVIRIGWNLFAEVAWLLCEGQPVESAGIPTLDLHIDFLRCMMVEAGITVVEIPPVPPGHDFAVCLTHDIDFVGIRRHKFDHTMWGFVYRSTVGAVRNCIRGKATVGRVLASWKAAATLPLVYLGWAKDFWMPFEWYLEVEKGLSPTYFIIPFKRRMGDKVTAPNAKRRASAYDIGDIPDWVERLQAAGCEVGVHGIDAWHSVEKGRAELERVAAVAGHDEMGIRMHWLLREDRTSRVLEQAGYSYDSTCGYNEAAGYRNGTTQVFRPLGAERLLELPMHIQDGALFYPGRMGLSEIEAWRWCEKCIAHASKRGGVLTILWHDRSHGPERFWGEFYARMVRTLKQRRVWFASGRQVVCWFRHRRSVSFRCEVAGNHPRDVELRSEGGAGLPPMAVRVHRPTPGHRRGGGVAAGEFVESAWNGGGPIRLSQVFPDLFLPAPCACASVFQKAGA